MFIDESGAVMVADVFTAEHHTWEGARKDWLLAFYDVFIELSLASVDSAGSDLPHPHIYLTNSLLP